jgi:2-polyprenyl-3-methyl-5-hydroxy-6-metoxy-1,4-benzoquinol methylase
MASRVVREPESVGAMEAKEPVRLTNPEREQDRAADLYETWQKYGYVMFPQQRSIYHRLAGYCAWRSVLEAGCGDGIGATILERRAKTGQFIATDKSSRNVEFARCLHPLITFAVWDITQPWHGEKAEVVVCVEAFEHAANPVQVLRNLLAAATCEVWISTPNGRVKNEHPPSNPWHVAEYTPEEMLTMCKDAGAKHVTIYHWETWEQLKPTTDVNPLVYRVRPQ